MTTTYHNTVYGRGLDETTTNGLVNLAEKLDSGKRHSSRSEEVGLHSHAGAAVRKDEVIYI